MYVSYVKMGHFLGNKKQYYFEKNIGIYIYICFCIAWSLIWVNHFPLFSLPLYHCRRVRIVFSDSFGHQISRWEIHDVHIWIEIHALNSHNLVMWLVLQDILHSRHAEYDNTGPMKTPFLYISIKDWDPQCIFTQITSLWAVQQTATAWDRTLSPEGHLLRLFT